MVKVICYVLVLSMMASIGGGIVPPVTAAAIGVTVTAERESVAGVELNSGFIIQSGLTISLDCIENFEIYPEVSFELRQLSPNEVYVDIPGGLAPRTVYSIRLVVSGTAVSVAFQTTETFRVTRTTPVAGITWVPVNAGIELYFSQPVNAADLEGHITITPPLEGRFVQFETNSAVFVPSDRMQHNTEYAVTLHDTLTAAGGDTLEGGFTFGFTTEFDWEAVRSVYHFTPTGEITETFLPDDPVVIRLSASSGLENQEAAVRLYRFAALDDYFAAAQFHRSNFDVYIDIEELGLELAAEFDQPLIMNSDLFWNMGFVPLPENPGIGHFIADIRISPPESETVLRAQKLIQVSEISVYMQTSAGQMLFWLNDTGTGEAIPWASITVGEYGAVTDENGIALLDILSAQNQDMSQNVEVRIRHEGREFGDILPLFGRQPRDLSESFFSYVYIDRAVYQPDDTLHFWGVAAPRDNSIDVPESITLMWTDGGLFPDGIDIEVNPDGTFTGSISFENRASRWEQLAFYIDGQHLITTGFTIMEYVKPIYTANLSADMPFYRRDDSMTTTVDVRFFDGTPASGVDVSFRWDGEAMYTDESGIVTLTEPVPDRSAPHNWRPQRESVNVTVGAAEHRTVWANMSYLLFPRDYIMEADIVFDGGDAKFVLDTHAINFDNAEQFVRELDILRGERADMRGTVTLHEVYFEKIRTGEFYDFITRQVVNRYRFERIESVVLSQDISTQDGHLTLPLPIDTADTSRSYFIELSLTAPDGTAFSQQIFAPHFTHWRRDPSHVARFFFDLPRQSSVGEEIVINVTNQDGESPEGGRVLYTVVGAEHMYWNVTEGNSFSIEFLPEYVPNVVVAGAFFTGRHIFSVSQSEWDWRYQSDALVYEIEDSRLSVAVTTDKARYAPGDEVTVSIEITNKDGEGVPASFILSVADEAAFAVMDQWVNPLGTLFRRRWISFTQFASYIDPYDVFGGAEGGDDGGDFVRRDFVDTAAFIAGTADQDGKAAVTFTLPDNLTAWRLTGIAYSDNFIGTVNVPYAGHSIENIQAGLPFFINKILNERYVTGDCIGVNLRSAGTSVRPGDVVMYTVNLTGEGVNDTLTARGRAGQGTTVAFDPLPPGTYTVTTIAQFGNYFDGIELEIEVVDSLLITSRRQSGNLADGIDISPSRFPVGIVLYDLENALLYDILYSLLFSFGDRADQRIVRAFAGQILNRLLETDTHNERLDVDGNELSRWNSMGVRLLPFFEEDVLLTARAVTVAPHFFERQSIVDYFDGVVRNANSESVEVAVALMGLAALREPVLPDVRARFNYLLEHGNSAFEEGLYLATALALFGDIAPALAWLDEAGDLPLNPDHDRLFAGLAVLAVLTGHESHADMMTTLLNSRSRTHLPVLELAVYVGRHSPVSGIPSSFSYNLGGQVISHAFTGDRPLFIELGEVPLGEADFTVTAGEVGFTARYYGGLDDEIGFPEGINVETTLSSQNIRVGDRVTVTTRITFERGVAEAGLYHIRQAVPSGLRFVDVMLHEYDGHEFSPQDRVWGYRLPDNARPSFHFHMGERNTINFYVGGHSRRPMPLSVTFSYEAIAVLPGEYIVESTALSISGGDTLYRGARSLIRIE